MLNIGVTVSIGENLSFENFILRIFELLNVICELPATRKTIRGHLAQLMTLVISFMPITNDQVCLYKMSVDVDMNMWQICVHVCICVCMHVCACVCTVCVHACVCIIDRHLQI